jgi:hypothetical protein
MQPRFLCATTRHANRKQKQSLRRREAGRVEKFPASTPGHRDQVLRNTLFSNGLSNVACSVAEKRGYSSVLAVCKRSVVEKQMTIGRPKFAPSEQQRALVRKLGRAGCSERAIAAAVGIDRATLRSSSLADEILAARLRARLQLVGRLQKQSRRGSVAATNALLKLLSRGDSDAASPPAADACVANAENIAKEVENG